MNVAEAPLRADPRISAIVDSAGTTTYGQLAEASGRLASALAGLGFRPGDRIALVLGNTRVHILAYLAVLRAGCVVVSVNPAAPRPELAGALTLCRPRAVVAAAALVPVLRSVSAALPYAPRVLSDVPADGAVSLDELLQEHRAPMEPVARHGEDPAAILFTSGSTGRPKGAVLTHGNVRWAAGAQASRMPRTEGSVTALAVPLHHCYGQNAVLNAAFQLQGAVALLDPGRKRWLAEDLHALRVTALPAVPATFRLLLDLGASATTLPRLRYAVSAAAELPAAVADEWQRRFSFPVHEGYGLTETSPCALYNDKSSSAQGSLGKPFGGVRTRVVNDAGQEVPDGTVGVLQLSGPNVMQGYFEDPAGTASVLADGWLTTGDCVRRDDHGDFWMVGREKNVIVVAGAKVFPSEVEAVVAASDGVLEAAVVGRPHPVVGETVTAFVRARGDVQWEHMVRTLQERCRAQLSPHKRPNVFQRVDSIPQLASGKPDLVALRRLALESAGPA
jgi:long-chain acyl-CoA synthetase